MIWTCAGCLNLAHMTLGEHPDKVDPRFRLDLDRFFHSEFDIGKFRDVGHLVGVNRYNQAGGAIMEDFDNDGLLDLAVTSIDPTQPMAFYRNKGDGTFEDRSEASRRHRPTGRAGLLPGRLRQRRPHGHVHPARRWLPLPIRPTLAAQQRRRAASPMSPRRPGLLDPVNSNTACLGRLRQRRLARPVRRLRAQTNRLYHNRGRRDVRGGRRQGRAVRRRRGSLLQGGAVDRLRQRWVSRPVPEQPRAATAGCITTIATARSPRSPRQWASMGRRRGSRAGPGTSTTTAGSTSSPPVTDRTLADVVKGLMGEPHNLHSNRLFRNRAARDSKT